MWWFTASHSFAPANEGERDHEDPRTGAGRSGVRRALVVCAGVLGVLLLGSATSADVFAVAKPETQTVAINGTAAQFDGSDSYTDEQVRITDWAKGVVRPIKGMAKAHSGSWMPSSSSALRAISAACCSA